MSKTLNQVLIEQYPGFDNSEWAVVIDRSDGNGVVFNREAWPESVFGTAPTDEQIEIWMSG